MEEYTIFNHTMTNVMNENDHCSTALVTEKCESSPVSCVERASNKSRMINSPQNPLNGLLDTCGIAHICAELGKRFTPHCSVLTANYYYDIHFSQTLDGGDGACKSSHQSPAPAASERHQQRFVALLVSIDALFLFPLRLL